MQPWAEFLPKLMPTDYWAWENTELATKIRSKYTCLKCRCVIIMVELWIIMVNDDTVDMVVTSCSWIESQQSPLYCYSMLIYCRCCEFFVLMCKSSCIQWTREYGHLWSWKRIVTLEALCDAVVKQCPNIIPNSSIEDSLLKYFNTNCPLFYYACVTWPSSCKFKCSLVTTIKSLYFFFNFINFINFSYPPNNLHLHHFLLPDGFHEVDRNINGHIHIQ